MSSQTDQIPPGGETPESLTLPEPRPGGIDWQSSTMQWHPEEEDCPVCRFLSGSTDPEDVARVIFILDANLARQERLNQALTGALIEEREKRNPHESGS